MDLIDKFSDVIQGKACQEKTGYKMNKRLHQCMKHNFLPSTNYKFENKWSKERREGKGREGMREREIDFDILINFKILV